MVSISRRKFLRFVPAAIGVIVLGVAVFPKDNTRERIWKAFYRAILRLPINSITWVPASATNSMWNVSKGKVKIREFAFKFEPDALPWPRP